MMLKLTITFVMSVLVCTKINAQLQAQYSEINITPDVKSKRVFMAGFGQNRIATGIHDPIMARCVVLSDGKQQIAFVSLDLIGFFHTNVENIRKKIRGIDHLIISSTHNHEGPDTLGLWGPNLFATGCDTEYLQFVENSIITILKSARNNLQSVTANYSSTLLPHLLHDARKPIVLHDEMTVISLRMLNASAMPITIIQWNCHPETLNDKNTLLSADFVAPIIAETRKRTKGNVLYLTGTVGGLLTSLHVAIRDKNNNLLKDGTFEKTEAYGYSIAVAACDSIQKSVPIGLTPFNIRTKVIYIPIENQVYRLAWQIGKIQRPIYKWSGMQPVLTPLITKDATEDVAIRSEVSYLRLGEFEIAAIPGEIYPELVVGGVQDPSDPNADFPNAPIEPHLYQSMTGKYRMVVGLANDELGYFIPKRQWDETSPYTYESKRAPYGEINSLGSNAATILCHEFKNLVRAKK